VENLLTEDEKHDFKEIKHKTQEIDIKNIQAILHQPSMNVINADIQVNRQYFLSKIPYGRRKTNKKLTYENKNYNDNPGSWDYIFYFLPERGYQPNRSSTSFFCDTGC